MHYISFVHNMNFIFELIIKYLYVEYCAHSESNMTSNYAHIDNY